MNPGMVHVFTTPWQPATFLVDHNIDPPMVFETPPRALIWCSCCKRRRWAEHVECQVYYDDHRARCKRGHGCRKSTQ